MGAKFVESMSKIRLLIGDSKLPRIPTVALFASLYSTPSPSERGSGNFLTQLSEENILDAVSLSFDTLSGPVPEDSRYHKIQHKTILYKV